MKRHRIQVLRAVGQSQRATAKRPVYPQTRFSASTRNLLSAVKSRALPPDRPRRGRPSMLDAARPLSEEVLRATPDLKTLEILHRVRDRGHEVGKSVVYDLVKKLRPEKLRPQVRFEGVPGEFSLHGSRNSRSPRCAAL